MYVVYTNSGTHIDIHPYMHASTFYVDKQQEKMASGYLVLGGLPCAWPRGRAWSEGCLVHGHGGHVRGRKLLKDCKVRATTRTISLMFSLKLRQPLKRLGLQALSLLSIKLRHCSNNVPPVSSLYLEFNLSKNCVAYDDG